MKNIQFSFLLMMFLVFNLEAEEFCDPEASRNVNVTINTDHVLRSNVPTSLFGFNLPWYAFQKNLQIKGKAKPELIEWLKPFEGALYRYPGGSPSNSFDWKNSVQPFSQRVPMHYEYGQEFIPEFGYDEFLNFVQQVNGNAILTLNMLGPYHKSLSLNNIASAEAVANDTSDFVNWILKASSVNCIGTQLCPISYLELGNELDWPPLSMSSKEYSMRASMIIESVSNRVPMSAWIANGKTAPWEVGNQKEGFKSFNQSVSSLLPKELRHLAYHPYYDGNSIPNVMKYADAFYSDWAVNRESASLIITEHARWPSMPKSGKWESRWYEGTGQGGAISSADFILSIISDQHVNGAAWHSLGTLGPWQLIRWDKKNNTLYPSPVYWGMRTLRMAFLEDAVEVLPSKVKGAYVGGYDLHFSAMKSNSNEASLLGINRSKESVIINLELSGINADNGQGILRISRQDGGGGEATYDDNNDMNKQRVMMTESILKHPLTKSKTSLCVPPKSVFSFVINSQLN